MLSAKLGVGMMFVLAMPVVLVRPQVQTLARRRNRAIAAERNRATRGWSVTALGSERDESTPPALLQFNCNGLNLLVLGQCFACEGAIPFAVGLHSCQPANFLGFTPAKQSLAG